MEHEMKIFIDSTERGYRIEGTNAGLEIFNDEPIASLTREICQNSMDVRYEEEIKEATYIEISTFKIPTKDIPDKEKYIEFLENNANYWDKRSSCDKRINNKCRRAAELLKKDYIYCLRASDFNNTGLFGIDGMSTPYDNLINSVGVSDKNGGAGGCYGLGKNAAFNISPLSTVFYASKTKLGEEYTVGLSLLPDYKEGNIKYSGNVFFGEDFGKPSNKYYSFDTTFDRGDRKGLDIFIIGIDYDETMTNDIMISLLNNFSLAIYNSNLIVKLENTLINNANIGSFIDKYKNQMNPNSVLQYELVTDENATHFFGSLFEENDVEYFVRRNESGKEGSRKIGIFRNGGMKILEKPARVNNIDYDAVIILKKDKINHYFKSFENPTHTKWREDLIKQKEDGEKKNKDLILPIKEWLEEKKKSEYTEITDVEGLSEFLPYNYIATKSNKGSKKEIISSITEKTFNKPINRKKITIETVKTPIIIEDNMDDNNASSAGEEFGYLNFKAIDDESSPNTTNSKTTPVTPIYEISEDECEKLITSSSESKVMAQKEVERTSLSAKIYFDENKSHLLLKTTRKVKNANLEVFISGEEGKYAAKIDSAKIDEKNVNIRNNAITIGDLDANEEKNIIFTIEQEDDEIFALEVFLYENAAE